MDFANVKSENNVRRIITDKTAKLKICIPMWPTVA